MILDENAICTISETFSRNKVNLSKGCSVCHNRASEISERCIQILHSPLEILKRKINVSGAFPMELSIFIIVH